MSHQSTGPFDSQQLQNLENTDYVPQWSNRNILMEVDKREIRLDIWERWGYKWEKTDIQYVQIFYDNVDFIIIDLDMNYRDGLSIIEEYIAPELYYADQLSENYIQIPIFQIGNQENLETRQTTPQNLIKTEVSNANPNYSNTKEESYNQITKDSYDWKQKENSSYFDKVFLKLDFSKKIKTKSTILSIEDVRNFAKGNNWFVDFSSDEKDYEQILKEFVQKCYSLGIKLKDVTSEMGSMILSIKASDNNMERKLSSEVEYIKQWNHKRSLISLEKQGTIVSIKDRQGSIISPKGRNSQKSDNSNSRTPMTKNSWFNINNVKIQEYGE